MKINLESDPYNQGVKLFPNSILVINPGLVALVGCNGSGKSTLIELIENFSNSNSFSTLRFNPTLDANQSIGEMYSKSFSYFLDKVDEAVQKSESENIVALADISQSGMTADVVSQFKIRLCGSLLPYAESKGVNLFVVISASDFEFVSDLECIDVQTFNRLRFNNYSSYKKYLTNSQIARDKRYKKIASGE